MSESVKFNPYIRPACLPLDSKIPNELNAMGWGSTGYAAPGSKTLLRVKLSYFNYSDCSQFYKEGEIRLKFGLIEETQICSGSRTDGQNVCGVSFISNSYLRFVNCFYFLRVIVEVQYKERILISMEWLQFME